MRKELDILGSRNALRVLPAVIEMLEQRQRPFVELVSRVYPFAQAADAFRDWDASPAKFSKILVEVGVRADDQRVSGLISGRPGF